VSLLELESVRKSFGGVRAVDDVSCSFEEGEIVGLIGPNGAGKTTLFNLVSGLIRTDAGRIRFAGRDITGLRPADRSRRGIGRTFQVVRPFTGMTVLENVMVPLLVRERRVSAARREAQAALDDLGIGHLADRDPAQLTLAQRKRVEVARALATRPRLLLLDEVLAGLNTAEVAEALPFVRSVRERGVTILMIEHLVAALMSVSDRVLVLDRGRLIASGPSDEVQRNPAVIEAYLGEEPTNARG
jgi:branched-chain amino acid transport system ATP-binding protein